MERKLAVEVLDGLNVGAFLDTRAYNGLLTYLSWDRTSIKDMCQSYLDHQLEAEMLRVPGVGRKAWNQIKSFIGNLVENDYGDGRKSLLDMVGSTFRLRRHGADYVLERAGVPYMRIVKGRQLYDGDGNYFREAI